MKLSDMKLSDLSKEELLEFIKLYGESIKSGNQFRKEFKSWTYEEDTVEDFFKNVWLGEINEKVIK